MLGLLLFACSSLSLALPSNVLSNKLPNYSRVPIDHPSNNGAYVPGDNITNDLVPRQEHSYQSFLEIGNGWNMYYSSWHAAALPIQPAAWALTNLYASMVAQAQGPWRKLPAQAFLLLNIGQVELRLVGSGQGIPWDFVEKFATHMLQITNGGWTGLYQVLLSQAESDTTIGVELLVLPGK